MEITKVGKDIKPKKLSVVFSFFNEEQVLSELIKRTRKALNVECNTGIISTYELIFVNDASTDASEKILFSEARGHNDIKIITMSRNFGGSPCVMAGLKYSTGDIVVYMDADLQDPPELIPEMLKAYNSGKEIDVVNTVRVARKGESFLKLLITKLGYKILKRVSSVNFLIEAGDFKLLSRRAVNHLLQMKEKLPFMRGLVYWIGFNQVTVDYHREPRFAGKAKFPLTDFRILHNFLFSALISFSDIPLQFSLLLGGITTILSFLYLVFVLIQKFVLTYTIPGWTTIMAVILFLGGVQLLTIGIVGLYINAIFLEAKGRPNYIVHRTFGFEDEKSQA